MTKTVAEDGSCRSAAERFRRAVPHDAGIGAPRRDRGVVGLRVGTSFHRPIFPPATLNPGLPATALHDIDAVPCAISDYVHMVGATGSKRAARVEQGRVDREGILTSRARDLAPGGRLILVNFGIDEAGRYLGATGGVNMFDMFNTLWAELRDEGVITGEEYAATNFPQCYRTVDEFTAPFADPEGPVRRAGLVLEHVETRVVRCPFAVAFGEHGDAARFAHEYIPTLRSWSEATFAAGLAPSRPGAERQAILDRLLQVELQRGTVKCNCVPESGRLPGPASISAIRLLLAK